LTHSSLQSLCRDLAAPEDLRAWISSSIPPGASLTGLNLFCTSDLPDRVLCLISFADALASEIAHALRGQAFGFDAAVVSLPVDSRFSCRCRRQGTEFTMRSCSCNPGGQPPSPAIDLD
jgi:hypothetical protein